MQCNKNIPELRFPEFKEEWEEKKLSQIIYKAKAGGTPKSSIKEYYNGNIPFLSINDMTNEGKYITYTEKSITEKGLKNSSAWLVPEKSLLYSMYASVGFVSINNIPLTTSQAIFNIIFKEQVSLEFMYYYLTFYKRYIHKYIETGTQGNLNAKLIKNFKIKIPSKEEQEKIANFLTCIDQKIELMEKEINKQSKYMKKIRENILNDNSDNSNKVQLKEICIINKGKQLNKTNMINDGKYYVLNGGKTPSGFTNSWNVPENTISISEGGNSCGFVNYNVQKFYCGGHCYYLTNISDEIDPLLLYHCLKMNENKIMNLRVGSGLPNIQKKDLEKYKLYIPTKNHEKITYLLNNINLKIDLNKEKLNHLKQFKKGLLQKMFC